MNNLSILKPTFFFFYLITIVTSAPPYTPTDKIFLNCGTSGISNAKDGRQWTGDKNSKFAPIEQFTDKLSVTTIATQESTVDPVPYNTARISRSQFTYTFPLTPGQKFIRLYFHSTSYPQNFEKYKDFFTVEAGSFTLLENFSASLYSDYLGPSFSREYCLNVEEGHQKLNITFTPTSNETYAFINGIEIVSMPTSLYYTSALDNQGPRVIGQKNRSIRIENNTALQNVYRLNVGGSSISPMQDTDMYRKWDEDVGNMYPVTGAIPTNLNISLKWLRTKSYTAPENVYRTGRSMGINITSNMQSNLTWLLFVDSGFRHLVRLHFCEIDPAITAVRKRRFNISIDNKIAEEDFDISARSGGKGIPMYMDYVVMIGNKIEDGRYYLFITLRPRMFTGDYVDALLNGIEVFKLSNDNGSLAAPNFEPRFSPPPPPTPPPPQVSPPPQVQPSGPTKKTLIIAGVGSAVGLIIVLTLLCCLVIWQLRRKRRYGSYYKPSWCCWWLDSSKGKSMRTTASSLPDELCRHFSLAEIKAATNNFHEDLKIGKGGFGNVFKGFMDEGSMVVAIKRLNPESSQGVDEFKNEIEMLSKLRHVHLVSLIGYCDDEREMILVYDFMVNGTLRDHLYGTDYDPLPWKQRLEICKGAAIGLNYLHKGLMNTIIHRDVKTTNILLDDKWTAKVSDFGLSKMDRNTSLVNTRVKGTVGYLDPEYARGHPLTEKSDVYSYGVVLFEVLCARRVVDVKLGEDQANLANWAQKCIDNGTFYKIIDPYLTGKIAPECFKVFLEIAESCVRKEGIKRPTMNDVMEKLMFALELQEKADADNERTHSGGEYMYPAISFPVARYDNVDGETDMDSSICGSSTTMDNNTTVMSFSSATVFWDTSNPKMQ